MNIANSDFLSYQVFTFNKALSASKSLWNNFVPYKPAVFI